LRKYDLLYSLNQYKFNNSIFLPILSNILNKIIGKNIEYNIINLKSVAYNTDLFTNALALKLKKKRINYIKNMFSILNRAYLPSVNTFKERSKGNTLLPTNTLSMLGPGLKKYNKDFKIISNIRHNNLSNLLDGLYSIKTGETLHNKIYDSVGYKNMGGIRLEVKGRLTKRYRADRSIYSLK
jgi:hypothetical protein